MNSYSPMGILQDGTRNITSVLHVLLRDPTVGSNYHGVLFLVDGTVEGHGRRTQ